MTKVLLVEDDNNLREIYEARLAAEGYEISAAQDGEEALEVAKKVQPDLIISDVMMPRISGFEMLDILRNTHGLQHTKVIMLTALGQEEDKTRADSLGADRYLVKSQVTLEDIVKAAQELLSGEAPATEEPAAPSQPSPELSPTAPPNVPAAAHTMPDQSVQTPQQPLSNFENSQVRPAGYTPNPAAIAPIQPAVEPAVASDPVATNDQALQEAVQALSSDPALAQPAAAPVTPVPVEPPVATNDVATPPVVAESAPVAPTPQPEVAAPVPVEPALATPQPEIAPAAPAVPAPAPEITAPAPEPQPAPATPIAPPEALRPELPSLPEIERAMEAPSPAPQSVVNGFPGIVTPDVPAPEPQPEVTTQAVPAPEIARPTIGGVPAPEVAAPALETQTTQQEADVVNQQINDFMNQFPGNVGEVVEVPSENPVPAPVEPVAAPAPAPEAPTPSVIPVEPAPADPVAAPTATPPTGGQRTIQPLASTAPTVDIHELAAREGSVEPPAGTPNLPNQPGGVFMPNSNGSAQDEAL